MDTQKNTITLRDQYHASIRYLAQTQRTAALYPSGETYCAMESAQRMRDSGFERWWRIECLAPALCE